MKTSQSAHPVPFFRLFSSLEKKTFIKQDAFVKHECRKHPPRASFENCSVFYPVGQLSAIFVKFEIVVGKLFHFGRV